MKYDRYEFDVEFDQVDLGGGVYHANYLDFLDRARVSGLKQKGLSFKSMIDSGQIFVVRKVEAEYLRPLSFEDRGIVFSRVSKIGNSSLTLDQCILGNPDSTREIIDPTLEDSLCFRAQVTLVCIDLKKNRPTTINKYISEKIR